MLRGVLLAASQNRWLRERAPRYGFVRRAVARFMPGGDVEAALAAARELRARGAGAVLTQLGENLSEAREALQVRRHYLDLLRRVEETGADVEISVKPTQLGLDFSREACEEHLLALAAEAALLGNWVWVDMESTAYTDATLDIYGRVRARHAFTGMCLQAYLYRTPADLEALVPLGAGVRLVKGAYREGADRAYPRKADVDESYFALARTLLAPRARQAGVRAIFATHDTALIGRIEAHARAAGLRPADLEFQMLYGIRPREQARLAAAGYRFRVLVSYGDAWFAWYMRRLAERPANLLFVLKSLLAR
ncbi:MAG TPA: proline dehydrogenase family protein [Vicinamibacteria bacterium]|nr:proline dehydrogenase family protein [Vicinamibacteria bacterium]